MNSRANLFLVNSRSSGLQMLYKKDVLKNFANSTRKDFNTGFFL